MHVNSGYAEQREIAELIVIATEQKHSSVLNLRRSQRPGGAPCESKGEGEEPNVQRIWDEVTKIKACEVW